MAKQDIVIEGARLIFKNFAGEEGKFNPAGNRNFCVLLEDDIAQTLRSDGWNIKELMPREEGDAPQPYLQVTVRFANRPPKVVMISSAGKTTLYEDEIKLLDYAEFDNVDLMISPYHWEVNGKSGIKAYLKSGYFTLTEDPLEKKYLNEDKKEEDDLPF